MKYIYNIYLTYIISIAEMQYFQVFLTKFWHIQCQKGKKVALCRSIQFYVILYFKKSQ